MDGSLTSPITTNPSALVVAVPKSAEVLAKNDPPLPPPPPLLLAPPPPPPS
jgi:hypothetical protein